MHTYTVVYEDRSGYPQKHTCPSISEEAAVMATCGTVKDELVGVITVVRHHTPKVTVVLDGDSVEGAYSDAPVELLHVYGDKESMYRAIENGQPVMPTDRRSLNLAHKLGSALAYRQVEVYHQPEAARFDHKYVNDPEMVEEYTRSVEEEIDHD